MPLDAAGFVVERPTLLTEFDPIDESRAENWRRFMIKSYIGRSRRRARHISLGLVKWQVTCRMTMTTFQDTKMFEMAPRDVRNMVAQIAKMHPMATAQIHWFDTDPILYIRLDEHDKQHCMAIWDAGVVRAIAGHAKLSVWQKGLRAIHHTV